MGSPQQQVPDKGQLAKFCVILVEILLLYILSLLLVSHQNYIIMMQYYVLEN